MANAFDEVFGGTTSPQVEVSQVTATTPQVAQPEQTNVFDDVFNPNLAPQPEPEINAPEIDENKELGFFDRLNQINFKRGKEITKKVINQPDRAIPERGLELGAQIVKGGFDVFGEVAKTVTPDFIEEPLTEFAVQSFKTARDLLVGTAETDTVEGSIVRGFQGGAELYQQAKTEYPRAAENFENAMTVLSIAPAKEGTRFLRDVTRRTKQKTIKLSKDIDSRMRSFVNPSDIKNSGKSLPKWRENNVSATTNIVKLKDKLEYTDNLSGTTTIGLPRNAEQWVSAVQQTKKEIWDQTQKILDLAGIDVRVDPQPMIEMLHKLKKKVFVQDFDPSMITKIDDQIERLTARLFSGGYTLKEAQDVLAGFNTKIKTFAKNQNLNELDQNLLNLTMMDSLSTTMDKAIDLALSQGKGKEFFDLRKAYGSLKQAEEIAVKTAKKAQALPNVRGMSMGDILSGGIGTYAAMSWNPKLMAAVAFTRGAQGIAKWRKGLDRNVRKMFSEADSTISKRDAPFRSKTMQALSRGSDANQ